MSRISLAFKSFFAILFSDGLPEDVAKAFGYIKEPPKVPVPKPGPEIRPADGAIQILSILQRDSRLIDFFMEDIAAYTDDQVGAAVRTLHDQSRQTLTRYLTLTPVIDGVEGTPIRITAPDPNAIKLLGNVPADAKKATQGILRHKGWKVESVDLPKLTNNLTVLAPAEIEIE